MGLLKNALEKAKEVTDNVKEKLADVNDEIEQYAAITGQTKKEVVTGIAKDASQQASAVAKQKVAEFKARFGR